MQGLSMTFWEINPQNHKREKKLLQVSERNPRSLVLRRAIERVKLVAASGALKTKSAIALSHN